MMPRTVVLFNGRDCPFKMTGGSELDSRLSGVRRVIKDLCEDADDLF